MLALFTLTIFVLTGITALAVDVSWYWANTLKVQRAADAAALAGVVWLPGQPSTAYATARDQAAKNGYTDTVGGVSITALKDATNNRRLNVTVSAPVGTFFMRIFGINSIQAVRSSKAEYVLPVPMGSPENYYGVLRQAQDAGRWHDRRHPVPEQHHGQPGADRHRGAVELDQPCERLHHEQPLRHEGDHHEPSTRAFVASRSRSLPAGSTITGLWVMVEGRASTTNCTVGLELSSNANAGTPTWTSTNNKLTMPSGTTSAADTNQMWPTAGNPSLWGRYAGSSRT